MTNTFTIVRNGKTFNLKITIDDVWDLQEQIMEVFMRTHSMSVMLIAQQLDSVAVAAEDGTPFTPEHRITLERAYNLVPLD